MTINAEFTAGSEIFASFEEAKRVANILGCNIEFKFNGVTCIVYPKGNSNKGVEKYHSSLRDDNDKFKIINNL